MRVRMNAGMPTPADQRLAPHRRLALAFAKAGDRIRRGGGGQSEAVWTRAMTAWLVAGLRRLRRQLCRRGGDPLRARVRIARVVRFMAWITNIGRSQWYLVPAGLVFFAVGLADWSRGGARAKVRLSFVFGQAAYVFSSVALSGLLVNAVKVLFGRARPRLLDQVGAHYFDPLTFGYLNASFPSGHSTTVGAIAGILMVWFPRWSLLIVELGLFFAATRIAAAGALSVRRGRRLSRRRVLFDRAGALAGQARRRVPARSRENPSGRGRAARQENRCRRDSHGPAILRPKP